MKVYQAGWIPYLGAEGIARKLDFLSWTNRQKQNDKEPGAWSLVPGAQNLEPGTWNLEPGPGACNALTIATDAISTGICSLH